MKIGFTLSLILTLKGAFAYGGLGDDVRSFPSP